MFQLENCEFLKFLGIPRGLLTIPGAKPLYIIDIKGPSVDLWNLVQDGRLAAANVMHTIDSMKAAGILPTLEDAFAKVNNLPMPEGLSQCEFVMCDCAAPMPHGYVRLINGQLVSDQEICDLTNGLALVEFLVSEKTIPSEQGIRLLKQMMAAKLPVNFQAAMERLSPKDRTTYERAMTGLQPIGPAVFYIFI